ncbi:MAG: GGDEF domain-containing protein [Haloechinothrix sp.]
MDGQATGAFPDSGSDQPHVVARAGEQAFGTGDRGPRTLRARWRTASLASGWRFPSDWALPEVDAVCAAVIKGGVSDTALAGLGRARAAAGAGLAETLADLAALHAVLAAPDAVDGFIAPDVDATPTRLVRVAALAWADVAIDQLTSTEVTDPLTGLPTAAYLRTRLAEVYREAARSGRPAAEGSLLLTVSVDLGAVVGWPRLTAMILVADVLRAVFDGGESVAVLGPSAIAVLTGRDGGVSRRAVTVRRELNERLVVDPQLHPIGRPRIRVVRLRPTFGETCVLLSEIARA